MNKKSCIDLINAIRLRKNEFKRKDGEISYEVYYKKSNNHRLYGDQKHSINLAYDEGWLWVRFLDGKTFCLTYVYGHEITSSKIPGSYSLDKIERCHLKEVFIPHACPSHPTTRHGAMSGIWSDSEDFSYQAGFYAATFFYALNIKNPALKLFNRQWVVEDDNLGQFDFFTYFSHHQVIPISLPFPKLIEETNQEKFKLAEGVELTDFIIDEEPVIQDLDDLRSQIYQN